MEIWSGHDLDDDGTNDLYVRHRGLQDPSGFGGIFLLLFAGLFIASFFLFGSFDDEEGSNIMGIGIFSILGSATVASLFAARICGWASYSYITPVSVLAGYLLFPPIFIAIAVMSREWKEEEARRLQATGHQSIIEKLGQIREQGNMVLDEASRALAQFGWVVKEAGPIPPSPNSPTKWHEASDVPDDAVIYLLVVVPPNTQGVTIQFEYNQGEHRSLARAFGEDPAGIILQAHERARSETIYQFHELQPTDIRELRPGVLRQLCFTLERTIQAAILRERQQRGSEGGS